MPINETKHNPEDWCKDIEDCQDQNDDDKQDDIVRWYNEGNLDITDKCEFEKDNGDIYDFKDNCDFEIEHDDKHDVKKKCDPEKKHDDKHDVKEKLDSEKKHDDKHDVKEKCDSEKKHDDKHDVKEKLDSEKKHDDKHDVKEKLDSEKKHDDKHDVKEKLDSEKKHDDKHDVKEKLDSAKSQSHTHEFEGSTRIAELGEDPHNHRFAGVSSPEIPVKGGHIHKIKSRTDFFDHLHYIDTTSGLQIPVGDGKHVHFVKYTTSINDFHSHELIFATLIESPTFEEKK